MEPTSGEQIKPVPTTTEASINAVGKMERALTAGTPRLIGLPKGIHHGRIHAGFIRAAAVALKAA